VSCGCYLIALALYFYWRAKPAAKVHAKKENRLIRLTEKQQKEFLKTLAQSPVGKIDIRAISEDFESFNFATELNNLLRRAGWQTGEVRETKFFINPKGLIITVNSVAASPDKASTPRKGFKAIGISSQSEINGKVPIDTLNLIVGLQSTLSR
jgi:hypothetical protein